MQRRHFQTSFLLVCSLLIQNHGYAGKGQKRSPQEVERSCKKSKKSPSKNEKLEAGEVAQNSTFTLPLSALLEGLGNDEQFSEGSQHYEVYSYHTKDYNHPQFFGPIPDEDKINVFLNILQNPKPFHERVSLPTLPLLIYGPTGIGKSTLSHTIAARAKARLLELQFKADWQQDEDLEELQSNVSQLMATLNGLSQEAQKSKKKNVKTILFLKNFDPRIPLYTLIEDKKFSSILNHVFIIASLKIENDTFEYDKIIHEAQAFIKIKMPRPKVDTQKQVILAALSKHAHNFTDKDIQAYAEKFIRFNGKEIKKLFDLAYREALYEEQSPNCQIETKHVDKILEHEAFVPQRDNTSYHMMYL